MPDEIEFLPQHDVDEEPLEPAPPRPRSRSAWIAVAVTAVVAIGVWVATRPTDSPPPAAAPSLALSAVSSQAPSPAPVPMQRLMTACVTDAPVDAAIVRALRKNLAGVRVAKHAQLKCVQGVRDDAQTVAERAAGSYRGLYTVVDVSARGQPKTGSRAFPTRGPGGTVFILAFETESAGLDVHVSVFGPSGARVPELRIQRLADELSLNLVL